MDTVVYNILNSKFIVLPESFLFENNYLKKNDEKNLKSSITVNFDNHNENKMKEYIFDYENLNIDKIKQLLKKHDLNL